MELATYNAEALDFGVFSVWGTDLAGTCRCPKGASCDQKPGKHPLTQHGFLDATRDLDRIRTMLSAGSKPNYGLVPPEGCFAWDLDGEGWRERIAELEGAHGPLPLTWTTRTPNNGQHRVFRWPEGLDRPRGQVFGFVARWGEEPGMGYIVGPGSRINGSTYVHLRGEDDWPLPIATFPETWARAAAAPVFTVLEGAGSGTGYQLPDSIDEGGRYDAIVAYVASRYSRGISEAEIWLGVRDILAPRFTVSLTGQELRSRFERAWRGTPERLGEPARVIRMHAPRAGEQPATTEIIDLATISTAPPPPLLVDRLDAEGHTILYGTGGVGKGSLACSWIGQLVDAGHTVLILDFEDHPTEWARRLSSLNPGALSSGRVLYWAPIKDGSLADLADRIRESCNERGVTYVVVDSAVMAAGADPLEPESAIRYHAALQVIGRSGLSLAHVTKVDDGRYPFGSIFWHNLARMTWSLASSGEGRSLLRNRKRNNGPLAGMFEVTTTWHEDQLREVWEKGWAAAIADRVWEILDAGGRTLAQIVEELNAEGGSPIKSDSVRRVISRSMPLRFRLSAGVYERAY